MEGEMMSQSASSDRNKRSFVEAFANLSTCTVCLEAFDEKVMQCQNGHLICGNCHATVSNSTSRCPSCNIALGNIRSLITEQLVQQQMKPCRFGCSDREMEYDERKQHERECNARPFCCPIAQCNEQITPASAVSHMKEMHKHEMILGKQTVCVNDTGITSGSASPFRRRVSPPRPGKSTSKGANSRVHGASSAGAASSSHKSGKPNACRPPVAGDRRARSHEDPERLGREPSQIQHVIKSTRSAKSPFMRRSGHAKDQLPHHCAGASVVDARNASEKCSGRSVSPRRPVYESVARPSPSSPRKTVDDWVASLCADSSQSTSRAVSRPKRRDTLAVDPTKVPVPSTEGDLATSPAAKLFGLPAVEEARGVHAGRTRVDCGGDQMPDSRRVVRESKGAEMPVQGERLPDEAPNTCDWKEHTCDIVDAMGRAQACIIAKAPRSRSTTPQNTRGMYVQAALDAYGNSNAMLLERRQRDSSSQTPRRHRNYSDLFS